MGMLTSTIKNYLLREPRHGIRYLMMTLGGCIVLLLALLYQELPQQLRILLFSIGALNILSGTAELMPEGQIRSAAALRLCFCLATVWTAVAATLLIAEIGK